MDLNDFFYNVSRIAVALETIAKNTTPVVFNLMETRFDSAGTEGRARPQVSDEEIARIEKSAGFTPPPQEPRLAEAPEPQAKEMDHQILEFVRLIYDEGTHTANGIAKRLVARGIPHPRGIKWNNVSAKHFMDRLGLKSPYSAVGGRNKTTSSVPAPADEPSEPAPEPDPEPATPVEPPVPAAETRPPEPASPPEPVDAAPARRVNRAFVERDFQPRRKPDAHMNLRGLLSEQTRANLEAHEKAQAVDRALIDEAIAAGRVTKLPACIDSNGKDHMETDNSGFTKSGGPSFGSNNGSRIQAKGSMN